MRERRLVRKTTCLGSFNRPLLDLAAQQPPTRRSSEPSGDFGTTESALEAVYLAASNDIKSEHGVTIRIGPPTPDAPATGGKT